MDTVKLLIGIDVGSTTVKAVVVDHLSGEIIWQDYQRHETKQPEMVLSFLQRIESDHSHITRDEMRLYLTGSGAMNISALIGAKFVQEVTAVCLAAEKLYPDVGSIIDLGGQDSKIIIFKEIPGTGRKKKIPSMNDKCAGGTGAVLDKINAKLAIPSDELAKQQYDGVKLHSVAGKCGVFAETDINSLQKQGVQTKELMASLFEAIVLQNLTVLTRGHTLRPQVLLIGGPNNHIEGIQQAWKHHISLLWKERDYPLPEGCNPKDLIITPDNALYFAAIGAIEYGLDEEEDHGEYMGWDALNYYIKEGRLKAKAGADKGLVTSEDEMHAFYEKYAPENFESASFYPGQKVEAFIGLDAGSTSTKAVLISPEKEVLSKAYQLSRGNPIEDTKSVLNKLHEQVLSAGATLRVLGLVTTGYAKDVLKEVLCADAAVVETVAHTQSALHYYNKVDVICDIGGQDIKIMMLKDGQVKDFELNTQCSAGNGYFLQSTAESFGIPVEKYAENAFKARLSPTFAYGCAVFLQSDIVNFQRMGWQREEILSGLANVLPKNVWLYVAQIPNFAKLGTHFVLQGGTQNNMAAVKAQVDFIESRFEGKPEKPTIIVHKHCGESGAIGAGLEAIRLWEHGRKTTGFIGMDATANIKYNTTCDESTRCSFCKNKCLRTFIDLELGENGHQHGMTMNQHEGMAKTPVVSATNGHTAHNGNGKSVKTRRVIVGNFCEKGSVEDVAAMRGIKKGLDDVIKTTPNLLNVANKELFRSYSPVRVSPPKQKGLFKKQKKEVTDRSDLRIGIPRVLLMYSLAPLFTSYFESLGVLKRNIIFSDFTSEQLYKEGGKRGAIDPCFPSKVTLSHVHNLLFSKQEKKPLNLIFFPMVGDMCSGLVNTVGAWVCPSTVPAAETVKAAFTKEKDIFKSMNIQYVNPFLNLVEKRLFEKQMFDTFQPVLGITRKENMQAVDQAYECLEQYRSNMRAVARETLTTIEQENKIGVVLLGRPYHKDPGINHEIFEGFQKLGYPILTQDVLPQDDYTMEQLFGAEVREGIISHPLDISDVWKRTLNTNVNIKLWAAKFVARHPNLVAVELSNFKCGHDAPTYTVIEEIIERSGTPFFSLKDLDENKPKGSMKLRIETIDYFLKQYRERIFDLVLEDEVY
ncbi:MAG: acyl-CoA dehydratase activase-related protein [Cyclobacteriaceae bacterium]|nr:acyl-CoA dehydratase activase-related protein [Cyclobacteriaceae bacterium]